jgi:hypothetical protein
VDSGTQRKEEEGEGKNEERKKEGKEELCGVLIE